MAIGLNTIYPSAKFISTDSKGDLQEITALDETNASATIQGIKVDSVASGVDGNGITFSITEQNSSDSISANGNTITLALNKDAHDYRLNEYGIDASSSASHLGIDVGEIIYFISDDSLAFRNIDTGTNETLDITAGTSLEVVDEDSSSRPIVEIDGTQYAVLAGNFKVTWGERLDSISTIISNAQSDVTNLVSLSITGANSENLTGTGSVVTEGGNPAQESDLIANSKYLLLNVSDIFDLEESEYTDGRKLFYGLLETATANIASSGASSESLVINRGNLVLVSENKLRRSYNITANLDILDSDLSNEV